MQPSSFLFDNPAKLNEISHDRTHICNSHYTRSNDTSNVLNSSNVNRERNANPPYYLNLNIPTLSPDNYPKLKCSQPFLPGLGDPNKNVPSGNVSPSSQNSSKGYKSATSSYYHYTEDGPADYEFLGRNFLRHDRHHLATDFLQIANRASRDETLVDADKTLPKIVETTKSTHKLLSYPCNRPTFDINSDDRQCNKYYNNNIKKSTGHQGQNYFKHELGYIASCASNKSDCAFSAIPLENTTTNRVKPSPIFPSNMAHFENLGLNFTPTFNQINQFTNEQNLKVEDQGLKVEEIVEVRNNPLFTNLPDRNFPQQCRFTQKANLKRRTVSVERKTHTLSDKVREHKSQTPSVDLNLSHVGDRNYWEGNRTERGQNTLNTPIQKPPSSTLYVTGFPDNYFLHGNQQERPTLITFSPSKQNLTVLSNEVTYRQRKAPTPSTIHYQKSMGDRASYKSSYETGSRLGEKVLNKSKLTVGENEIWQPREANINRKLVSEPIAGFSYQQRASTTIYDSEEDESIEGNVFVNETHNQMPCSSISLVKGPQNLVQLKRRKAKSIYGGDGYVSLKRHNKNSLGDISLSYVIHGNQFENLNEINADIRDNKGDPTLVSDIDYERLKLFYTSSHKGTRIIHICQRFVQLFTSIMINNDKRFKNEEFETKNGADNTPVKMKGHVIKSIPNFKLRKSLRLKFADNHSNVIQGNNRNRTASSTYGVIGSDFDSEQIHESINLRWKRKFTGIALILASDVVNCNNSHQITKVQTRPTLVKSQIFADGPKANTSPSPGKLEQKCWKQSSSQINILPNPDFDYLTSSSKIFKIPCSALTSLNSASTNQNQSIKPSSGSIVQKISLVIAEPGTGFLLWKADLINFERYVKPSGSTASSTITKSPTDSKKFVKYTARSGIKEYMKTRTLSCQDANNQPPLVSDNLDSIYHIITRKCDTTSGEKIINNTHNTPNTIKIALGFHGDLIAADKFSRTICEILHGQSHKLRTIVEKTNSNTSRNDKTAMMKTDWEEKNNSFDGPTQTANIFKRTYSCRFLNNSNRTTPAVKNNMTVSLLKQNLKDDSPLLKVDRVYKKVNETKKRSYSLDNINRINLGVFSRSNCIKTNPHIITDSKSKTMAQVTSCTLTLLNAKEMPGKVGNKSHLQKSCETKKFYPATLFNSLKIFEMAKKSLNAAFHFKQNKRSMPLRQHINLGRKEKEPGNKGLDPTTISLPCQFHHVTTIKQTDFENYYSLKHLLQISNNGYY